MSTPQPRSFRLACPGAESAAVLDLLRAEGFAFQPLPFHAGAFVLESGPLALGSSLAARFGLIYIQDRSSMLPPLALAPDAGAPVLDMCASPGGKTSLLALLTGPAGLVLGNEPGRDRLATLRMNLKRMGAANVLTCSLPGEDLPLADGTWPFILLDPPCSGWGTVDKNPLVAKLWTPEKTEPLVGLQRALLRRAAGLLAPGGRLLYSTCTTNIRENEEQAAWAASELGLELLPLAPFAGFAFHAPRIAEAAGTLCVDGAGSQAQGFFLALLRRPGASVSASGPAGELSRLGAGLPGEPLPGCLLTGDGLDLSRLPTGEIFDFKGRAVFIPRAALDFPVPEGSGFRFQGLEIGRIQGGRLHPDPAQRLLLPPYVPGRGINAESPSEILPLLSGQSVQSAGGAGGGWAGLYFRGLPLARLTRKGNRLLYSIR